MKFNKHTNRKNDYEEKPINFHPKELLTENDNNKAAKVFENVDVKDYEEKPIIAHAYVNSEVTLSTDALETPSGLINVENMEDNIHVNNSEMTVTDDSVTEKFIKATVTNCKRLNVRENPSMASKIITIIDSDSDVLMSNIFEENNFKKVLVKVNKTEKIYDEVVELIGYCSSDYIQEIQ